MGDLFVAGMNDGMEIELDPRGNPILTGGLDSSVYLSTFVGPWWGNRVADSDERFTSTVIAAMSNLLTLGAVRDVVAGVRAALNWLVVDGAAQELSVDAEIHDRSRLDLLITITEPNRRRTTYRYGLNWASQSIQILQEGRQ